MRLSTYPLYRFIECTSPGCRERYLVKSGTTIHRVLEDMRKEGWRKIPWPKGLHRTRNLTFSTAMCPRCVDYYGSTNA